MTSPPQQPPPQQQQGTAPRGRGGSRRQVVCYYCNIRGHTANKCQQREADQGYNNQSKNYSSDNSKVAIEDATGEQLPPEDYIDMNNCYISEVNSFKFDIDSECVISDRIFKMCQLTLLMLSRIMSLI